MNNKKYVHTHVHTVHSLLDGYSKIDDLIVKAIENNICFHIKAGNKEIKVWSWKFTETYKQLGEPKLINLVCSLEIFNGMNVMDIYSIEAA